MLVRLGNSQDVQLPAYGGQSGAPGVGQLLVVQPYQPGYQHLQAIPLPAQQNNGGGFFTGLLLGALLGVVLYHAYNKMNDED